MAGLLDCLPYLTQMQSCQGGSIGVVVAGDGLMNAGELLRWRGASHWTADKGRENR